MKDAYQWPRPRYWKIRLWLFGVLFRRRPKTIVPGQVWWPHNGHASQTDCRIVYITLSKDHEGYWWCAGPRYFRPPRQTWMGGNGDHRLTETELLAMTFIEELRFWKLGLTLGSYRDFLMDRSWQELPSYGETREDQT